MHKRSIFLGVVLVAASAGGWLAQPAVLGRARAGGGDGGDSSGGGKFCSFTVLAPGGCDWQNDGGIHCLPCGTADPNGVGCGGIYIVPSPPPASFPSNCGGASLKSTNGGCVSCVDDTIGQPIDDGGDGASTPMSGAPAGQ